ncbi:hypothetical protein F5Y18DRAFT_430524 [Xylariaceae sp. FL1019]|nr:hypothetical protein F5Y18DRAFT_430524 [Xylariaceae sp. FL1019]
MAVELETKEAFAPLRVSPAHDSDHPRACLVGNEAGVLYLTSSSRKMKAVSQRPGPNGSRVIKKRSSIPHLGDGLTAVLATINDSQSQRFAPPLSALTDPVLKQAVHTCVLDLSPPDLYGFPHLQSRRPAQNTPGSGCADVTSTCNLTDVDNQIAGLALSGHNGSKEKDVHLGDNELPLLSGNDVASDDETSIEPLFSSPTRYSAAATAETTPSSGFAHTAPGAFSSHTTDAKVNLPSFNKRNVVHASQQVLPQLADNLAASVDMSSFNQDMLSAGLVEDQHNTDVDSLRYIVEGFLTSVTGPANEALNDICHQVPSASKPLWTKEKVVELCNSGDITLERAGMTGKRQDYTQLYSALQGGQGASVEVGQSILQPEREVEFQSLNRTTSTNPSLSPSVAYQEAICAYDNAVWQAFENKCRNHSARDHVGDPVRPLHIFVDMSNIFIGFCDSWKISQNIPVFRNIRAPKFNFRILTCILERSRAVDKRVLAGSVPTAGDKSRWPGHFVEAHAQGYKMNVLNRVQKLAPIKAGRRRKQSPPGPLAGQSDSVTSGDESTENPGTMGYETKNGEQGVDEILHLNMMDSVVDYMQSPATMVLATGDAAQAEFSDGFLQYAIRALENGWNLELVTWKRAISSAWKRQQLSKKYGRRFRIIYLDEFLDELNADVCFALG